MSLGLWQAQLPGDKAVWAPSHMNTYESDVTFSTGIQKMMELFLYIFENFEVRPGTDGKPSFLEGVESQQSRPVKSTSRSRYITLQRLI